MVVPNSLKSYKMTANAMHEILPPTLRAEPCDQLQFLLRSGSDQQMRMVIEFSARIDDTTMKNAARLSILAEPIFSYKYEVTGAKAVWIKHTTINEDDLFSTVYTNDLDFDLAKFLIKKITPNSNPIVQLLLLRSSSQDILCINMNHTPSDGIGLKEYAYLLADIYNKLQYDPNYLPRPNIKGNRSMGQVLDQFTLGQRLGFLWGGIKAFNQHELSKRICNENNTKNKPYIISLNLDPDTLQSLKYFAKKRHVTLNDVFLTCYARAINSISTIEANEPRLILIPVDLRRYLSSQKAGAICSLTSLIICKIESNPSDSFFETLHSIHIYMDRQKANHSGLSLLTPILRLSKFLSTSWLRTIIANHIKHSVYPIMTNVGIIDATRLIFNKTRVINAKILGSIIHTDCLCLTISTFDDRITTSVSFLGNEKRNNSIHRLLNEFVNQFSRLNSLCVLHFIVIIHVLW